MTKHMTGTRKEWLASRLELLEAEKELTRRSDELALASCNITNLAGTGGAVRQVSSPNGSGRKIGTSKKRTGSG